jgi:hypothetical protein
MPLPARLITLLMASCLARGEGLDVLRASLEHLKARAPVAVEVDFFRWRESISFIRPVIEENSTHLSLRETQNGLLVEGKLPFGQEPLPAGLSDLVNPAELLCRNLEAMHLLRRGIEDWQGSPTQVLIFGFAPAISPEHRGHVSAQEATLKIWVGENGQPLEMETRVDYKGRHSRLCGRFHVRSRVRTGFMVLGQRLVVATQTSEDFAYDAGERTTVRKMVRVSGVGEGSR